jgi:hypothetical protein
MDNKSHRSLLLSIDKQDHHLAITLTTFVMGTRTIGMSQARYLKIKRSHDAIICAGQLLADPDYNLLACLIEN